MRKSLAQHMSVNRKEKPYKCLRCKKTFSQKRTLVEHVTVHTGERLSVQAQTDETDVFKEEF